MKWLLLLFVVLPCVLVGAHRYFPSDVVTLRYRTLGEARSDQLFSRGWLPDILPPSSRDLHLSNHLDWNQSYGAFSFDPLDFDSFASKLRPYPINRMGDSALERQVAEKRLQGFRVGAYEENTSLWLFFCKAQKRRCEYILRTR